MVQSIEWGREVRAAATGADHAVLDLIVRGLHGLNRGCTLQRRGCCSGCYRTGHLHDFTTGEVSLFCHLGLPLRKGIRTFLLKVYQVPAGRGTFPAAPTILPPPR